MHSWWNVVRKNLFKYSNSQQYRKNIKIVQHSPLKQSFDDVLFPSYFWNIYLARCARWVCWDVAYCTSSLSFLKSRESRQAILSIRPSACACRYLADLINYLYLVLSTPFLNQLRNYLNESSFKDNSRLLIIVIQLRNLITTMLKLHVTACEATKVLAERSLGRNDSSLFLDENHWEHTVCSCIGPRALYSNRNGYIEQANRELLPRFF